MSHEQRIAIFPSATEIVAAFAADFAAWSEQQLQVQSKISVALSGGSTPKRLFELWGKEGSRSGEKTSADQPSRSTGQQAPRSRIQWNKIHFFWGDERCVPPHDPESNFGVADQLWLSKIEIDPANIHRIRGEHDPHEEARRYEGEILQNLMDTPIDQTGERDSNVAKTADVFDRNPLRNQPPRFDLVILGMGVDGHIASIFPDQMELLTSPKICGVAHHPVSKQRRVTLTGTIINHAAKIVFLITGNDKAEVLRRVIERREDYRHYPAAHIDGPQVSFYLDEAAAGELTRQNRTHLPPQRR